MLFGGTSSEREISLLVRQRRARGAQAKRGVDAHRLRSARQAAHRARRRSDFDRVWIALHGPGGEDGTLQGALEYLGLPYTGSGVMGSAIGMDKLRTKRLAQAVGVRDAPTTSCCAGPQDFDTALERLGLPMIVKPATQGSSVGMTQGRDAPSRSAGRLPGRRAARARACSPSRGSPAANTRSRAAGTRAAVDPHRDAARRSTTTRPSTSATTRGTHCPSGLSHQAEKHLANLALATFDAVGRRRLGPRRFHDGHDRPAAICSRSTPFPA